MGKNNSVQWVVFTHVSFFPGGMMAGGAETGKNWLKWGSIVVKMMNLHKIQKLARCLHNI